MSIRTSLKSVRGFRRNKLAEVVIALEGIGPQLGRPLADTLNGSKHRNMKEIRFATGGAWRFAFAFDPERRAVILVGGNKEGTASRQFYKSLIATADKRFDEWLEAEE
ncbi:type II toxin-antitoxin system RelE/ParE family toxin [Mesorhizobium sp. f-mel]